MGYMWLEEMGLIVNLKKENSPAQTPSKVNVQD